MVSAHSFVGLDVRAYLCGDSDQPRPRLWPTTHVICCWIPRCLECWRLLLLDTHGGTFLWMFVRWHLVRSGHIYRTKSDQCTLVWVERAHKAVACDSGKERGPAERRTCMMSDDISNSSTRSTSSSVPRIGKAPASLLAWHVGRSPRRLRPEAAPRS